MSEVTGVGIDRTLDEGPLASAVSTRSVRGVARLVVPTNEGLDLNGTGATLTLIDSNGSGNTAGGEGGGIFNQGELDSSNSTIAGDPP
jgi:hypothetical protein